MAKSFLLLFLIVTFFLFSCTDKKKLQISPIDAELNTEMLTGKGLDTNYFSTNNVLQYYEIDFEQDLEPEALHRQLADFVAQKYGRKLSTLQELRIFFYKKKWFTSYGDKVYRSARESENGRIEDQDRNLRASITYERQPKTSQRFIVNTSIYAKSISYSKADTLTLTTNR